MGDGPEWVVADGAGAIAIAIARRWPNVRFYSCEFHLGWLASRMILARSAVRCSVVPARVTARRASASVSLTANGGAG